MTLRLLVVLDASAPHALARFSAGAVHGQVEDRSDVVAGSSSPGRCRGRLAASATG